MRRLQYHNLLEEVLGQKSKVKILRYLAKHPDEESGRQIAIATGMSPTKCHEALADLVDQGAITVKVKGRMYLYSLNRGAYIVDEVLVPLFDKERGLIDTVIADVAKAVKKDTLSIVLFGSITKQEELPDSDINIIVIAKDGPAEQIVKKTLEDIAPAIHNKYGNKLSSYVLTVTEYLKRYKKGDDLLIGIEKIGYLVYGKTIEELMVYESKT